MGNDVSSFNPVTVLATMMLVSAVIGFIFMRESFGYPRAAWLRSENGFKRGVTMGVYFIGCFLPACCAVMLVYFAPLSIDSVNAAWLRWPWQLRFGSFAAALLLVWLALSALMIRHARSVPNESELRAERAQDANGYPLSETKLRVSGAVLLAIALAGAWSFVYQPYLALQSGVMSVAIKPLAIATLPFILGCGLALGVIGRPATVLIGKPNSPTLFGRAFAVVLLVAGVILAWWMTELGAVVDSR